MARPAAGARGHVLVVEDNPANQVLAVRMLDRLGYSADVAVNGLEAVEATARQAYGAILMDCNMPVMDGYEATEAIRGREGPAVHTPIIAMTAGVLPEERERCLAAGMDDYVAKPVSLDDVRKALHRWVPDQAAAPARSRPAGPTEEAGAPDPAEDDWAGTRSPLFNQLLEAFLAGAPQDIARLRAAVAREDTTALERVAHHLKGGALTFGLDRAAASCQELELLARSGVLGPAGDLVDRLEEELGRPGHTLMAKAPTLDPSREGKNRSATR